jgi:enoyl-CoA hydratase/carnithine racemase
LLLTGVRIGGIEAKELGIVDEAVPGAEVLPRAVAHVASLASKNRGTFGAIKKGMHSEALALLEGGVVNLP